MTAAEREGCPGRCAPTHGRAAGSTAGTQWVLASQIGRCAVHSIDPWVPLSQDVTLGSDLFPPKCGAGGKGRNWSLFRAWCDHVNCSIAIFGSSFHTPASALVSLLDYRTIHSRCKQRLSLRGGPPRAGRVPLRGRGSPTRLGHRSPACSALCCLDGPALRGRGLYRHGHDHCQPAASGPFSVAAAHRPVRTACGRFLPSRRTRPLPPHGVPSAGVPRSRLSPPASLRGHRLGGGRRLRGVAPAAVPPRPRPPRWGPATPSPPRCGPTASRW